jgi:uncharacterized membrane protein YqjE
MVIRPSRILLILLFLMLTPIFPPLLIVPIVLLVVWGRSKVAEHNDPQAVAWRQAQEWYRPNG